MGILGITNRTEDWKTAMTFAPFFECDSARTRLANRLLEPLGEDHEVQQGTAKIELFWYGMRDSVHKLGKKSEVSTYQCFADRYNCQFHDLRELIEEAQEAQDLRLTLHKSWNYKPDGKEKSLYNNLCNTEIDIVLETSKHLFAGEAKHESDLGTNGELVLVHQLIRQYVMARILVDWREFHGWHRKDVIPFVVADKEASLKTKHQVKFMVSQGWLKEENVLSWDCIDEIAKSASADN